MIIAIFRKIKYLFIIAAIFLPLFLVQASDFTSTNFKATETSFDSTIQMTSTNYSVQGILSQFSIGSSTANTFKLNSGLLYFPKVTSPVLTASAGATAVTLTWTSALGYLGINVSGYQVGQSTTAGGPYTYTEAGNVTEKVVNSLTGGQTYYFVVRAEDAFGEVVATSGEVSVIPLTAPQSGSITAGGGGQNFQLQSKTKITIQGLAYPYARIVILKDAAIGAEITADMDGNFSATFGVSVGIYSFGIYALDKDGFKSPTFGFTVNSMRNQTVTTSDIIMAPTIGADKSIVKVGNTIKFFGYAYPISSINIMINSKNEILDQTVADKYGRWFYTLSTDGLELGDHTAKSQTIAAKILASAYSSPLSFTVGDQDVINTDLGVQGTLAHRHGDINGDGKINITDFSILMYFWNIKNSTYSYADINSDGLVNLKDFSIMLYWWSGK